MTFLFHESGRYHTWVSTLIRVTTQVSQNAARYFGEKALFGFEWIRLVVAQEWIFLLVVLNKLEEISTNFTDLCSESIILIRRNGSAF